jgi:site-specific recombinase XerD
MDRIEDPNVVVVLMLTPSRAVDLFLGDLTRRSRSQSGSTAQEYRRLLDKFTDSLRQDIDVTDIRPDDCRRFLDRYAARSANYQATIYSTLNSFLEWLYQQQRIKRNPLDHVARPRRIAAEDLNVTTIATVDVPKLLSACRTESERLTLGVLAYMGPRRNAVARLRLRDYDRESGHIRFSEKGTKSIRKPVPFELRQIIEAAIARGAVTDPDGYLIPPEGPLSRKGERDDRVIWRIVKKVAERAGVEAHVHALRAAFATFYLEQNPSDIVGLQELLGHRSIETTKVYLRKLDKQRSMEPVRTLSWAGVAAGNEDPAGFLQIGGTQLESSLGVGAGGFEPPSGDFLDALRPGRLQSEAEVVE